MPKEGKTKEGQPKHYSVGIIIERGDKILMIDRMKFPFGWTCPAGHIDEGENPREAAIRETQEEIGCKISNLKLLVEIPDLENECRRGIKFHHWFGFTGTISEIPNPAKDEVKDWKWVKKDELKDLNLEPIGKWWFKEIGWIK